MAFEEENKAPNHVFLAETIVDNSNRDTKKSPRTQGEKKRRKFSTPDFFNISRIQRGHSILTCSGGPIDPAWAVLPHPFHPIPRSASGDRPREPLWDQEPLPLVRRPHTCMATTQIVYLHILLPRESRRQVQYRTQHYSAVQSVEIGTRAMLRVWLSPSRSESPAM